MKLLNRLKNTTKKDKYVIELDVMIYENNIIWYMIETMQFNDGDEFTEDQSVDDYIKNGPPSFAADIPHEMINEIDRSVKKK